jgi:hypothetical protein
MIVHKIKRTQIFISYLAASSWVLLSLSALTLFFLHKNVCIFAHHDVIILEPAGINFKNLSFFLHAFR